MNFEQNIKQWVTIDNKEKQLRDHVKALRQEKNKLSDEIFAYAEENNLEHATVEISDGKLKFQSVKTTAPISFKYVEKCLGECIADISQVKIIIDYIKSNRESKYVSDIKRTYKKTT